MTLDIAFVPRGGNRAWVAEEAEKSWESALGPLLLRAPLWEPPAPSLLPLGLC